MTQPFRERLKLLKGKFTLNTDLPATTLLFGAGTTSTRYAMGTTANLNAIGLFVESTATSGDARAINSRLYFSGVGGSGEVGRFYGIVNNVTAATDGTVNGIHASLGVAGAAGAVSGQGNAIRATLDLGTGTKAGGTLAVITADTNIASDANIPAGTAFFRMTNVGSKSLSYAFRLPTVASAGLLAVHTTDAMTHSVRCISEEGVVYYLMATTTNANRTGGA